MIIRNDIRQSTLSKAKMLGGYPVVNQYKYLGVTIDCTGKFEIMGQEKKQLFGKLEKKKWILSKSSLAGSARTQLWQSLFRTSWQYGLDVLLKHPRVF